VWYVALPGTLAAFAQHILDEAELHQEQYLLWNFGLWTPKARKILGATFDQD
jgi:hypothetical protein